MDWVVVLRARWKEGVFVCIVLVNRTLHQLHYFLPFKYSKQQQQCGTLMRWNCIRLVYDDGGTNFGKGNSLIIRFWQYGLLQRGFIHSLDVCSYETFHCWCYWDAYNICSLHLVHWPFLLCWAFFRIFFACNMKTLLLQEVIACNKLPRFSQETMDKRKFVNLKIPSLHKLLI